eukprot:TRINITY_DN2025_c2_g3_i2.p2 TRINITY_DN2025_c2_g3~~TRINITY_DN2025_c2_g3_i2.p2  ORF type:complete len:302 (-),score=100.01 TRINITY_DN2025_c2_g3_i2:59-964(-)
MGTGGIRIGSGVSSNFPRNINVSNSTILHGGHAYPSGCGVLIQMASDCTIEHNEIGNFSYTGISVGWNWEYGATVTHNNRIAYNHIHDIGRWELSDMGGIYTLGESNGTVVYNNLVHDVFTYNYGGWGIYPDQASSEIEFRNNIVHTTKGSGLHQHFGMNNVFRNNIFAFGGILGINEGGALRTDPDPGQPNSLIFVTNIVYLTSSTLFYGNWNLDSDPIRIYNFNLNVYWKTENETLKFPVPTGTFQEWKSVRKMDLDSIIADPEFQDESVFNFNLKKSSPAFKLGFVNIDTNQIGPIKD